MTILLHDNQGRDWTVEGDWSAQVMGADFDGHGQILMWISPDNADAYLKPAPIEIASRAANAELRPGDRPLLED